MQSNETPNVVQQQPTPPANPSQPHHKTIKERTYALRFVLSLIFGNIFIGCLLYCIIQCINYMFKGSETLYFDSGDLLAGIITAIIIFGGFHIWFSLSTKKPAHEPYAKWQNVLSIIYCSAWALVGLYNLWIAISMPISALLRLSESNSDILPIITISISIIVLLLIAIIEQMHIFPKLPKLFYAIFMSSLSIILIVYMLIFPASTIRNIAYDEQIIDDLSLLKVDIEDYVYEKYHLPNNLNDLKISEDTLNFDVNKYNYTKKSTENYQLCADFKTDTINVEKYRHYGDFYEHTSGNYCFDLEVSIPYHAYYETPDPITTDCEANNDNCRQALEK